MFCFFVEWDNTNIYFYHILQSQRLTFTEMNILYIEIIWGSADDDVTALEPFGLLVDNICDNWRHSSDTKLLYETSRENQKKSAESPGREKSTSKICFILMYSFKHLRVHLFKHFNTMGRLKHSGRTQLLYTSFRWTCSGANKLFKMFRDSLSTEKQAFTNRKWTIQEENND